MTVSKVSLSICSTCSPRPRGRAGRQELSSFVTDALRRQLQHGRPGELPAEMEAESDPIPDELLEARRTQVPPPHQVPPPQRLILDSRAVIALSRNDQRARRRWPPRGAGVAISIPSLVVAETVRGSAKEAPQPGHHDGRQEQRR